MKQLIYSVWQKLAGAGLLLSLPWCADFTAANAGQSESEPPLATNLFELRSAITPEKGRLCAFDLEGTVLAAADDSGILFFQDCSEAAVLDAKLNGSKLLVGQRIRLRGTNYVSFTDVGLSLGTRPVVDADGLHSTLERDGAIFLGAGRHPIQVNWFNWVATAQLNLAYSGPNLTKQTIPDNALWQTGTVSKNEAVRELQGLKYRCFEGKWDRLPDFDRLTPIKAGVVSNLDIDVRIRPENVGLEFKGFLDVPCDGNYTFYLSSDDGSKLFLDSLPPSITVFGITPLPEPTPITASQPLAAGQNSFWAEVEGTVTFLNSYHRGVQFELTSDGNRIRVEVLNAPPGIPSYLLHNRVRIQGVCPVVRNADGQTCAGLIVAAGWQSVRILKGSPESWPAFRDETIGGLSNAVAAGNSGGIVHLHGQLYTDPTTQTVHFKDETGSTPIQLLSGIPVEIGTAVNCLSRWFWDGTNISLQEAICIKSPNENQEKTDEVHVLTTALQVQQLKPEEAQRQYPVEIQGVVIWANGDFTSLVIQDLTRAVYVTVDGPLPQPYPHIGDYCKIKGFTLPGEFSPIVALQQTTVLCRGQMPRPISPTRDQLLNGSQDAQYVELRGMVTAVHDSDVTLLTSEGVFDINISPAPDEPWEKFINTIIRVRGCFFADWDKQTRRVILDRPVLRIWSATISVDAQASTDLFQAVKVPGKELMRFDARFDPFQWVKVSGQIIHGSPDMYYLMDGVTGLRFRLAQSQHFDPGDKVDVVGLVELGGASPLLRQAVARKTGNAPLPEPRLMSLDLPDGQYDSTLVWVEGTLVDVKDRGAETVLEMQVGVKSIIARLMSKQFPAQPWQIGSRLKLTGVYHTLDEYRMADGGVSSFELLLNSPTDVQIVTRPPWWTLGRVLAMAAMLVVGLALAFVWITVLRRQVERRTLQLRHEIGQRQQAEKMRAIEQERSRIARDLHDNLGSELTEISMMASANPRMKIETKTAVERLRGIAEKSRAMISALDGVVWVVNSKNDTLSSLIEYLASNAEEFLAKAGIACRVEIPPNPAEKMIAAEVRNDVLLAVREVFNNAVRHGHPSKVLLRFGVSADILEILIKDNGCGFETSEASRGNGLRNIHERMHKLGGHCQIQSSPTEGTTVILRLPLRS